MKHSQCCVFWLVCTLFLRKKRGQNIEACTMNATKWNKSEYFHCPVVLCILVFGTRGIFFLSLLFLNNSLLLKEEKIHPEKSLGSVLFLGLVYVFLLGVWLGCLVLVPTGIIRPLYTTPCEYHTTWRRPVYSRLFLPYCYILVCITCYFFLIFLGL